MFLFAIISIVLEITLGGFYMNNMVRNKRFLSLEDQEDLLVKRKLHIKEEDRYYNNSIIKKELLDKGYFDLINGFEDLFLVQSIPEKKYLDTSIYDFLSVYNFDVELSSIILKKIEIFEKMLITRVAYYFSEQKCSGDNKIEDYTNINNYILPDNRDSRAKFKDHNIFKSNFISKKKNKYDYVRNHDKLPFWVAIKTLTLGEV